ARFRIGNGAAYLAPETKDRRRRAGSVLFPAHKKRPGKPGLPPQDDYFLEESVSSVTLLSGSSGISTVAVGTSTSTVLVPTSTSGVSTSYLGNWPPCALTSTSGSSPSWVFSTLQPASETTSAAA